MGVDALLGYIDPTSGSLVVQFVIAAAASVAFVVRRALVRPFVAAGRLIRVRRSRDRAHLTGPNG